jgi:predicted nucleic acid-binding protein
LAGSLAYVDTSAYLKLLFTEHETQALETVISEWPDVVSSELLEVEMHRAAYRAGLAARDCDDLLDAVNFVAMDEPIRRHSHRIAQPLLRAGDAIHLATGPVLVQISASSSPTTSGCSTVRYWRDYRPWLPSPASKGIDSKGAAAAFID